MTELESLRARDKEIDAEVEALREAQRGLRERIDALALAQRPSYPTPAQVEGVAEAARRIRAKIKPGSHHGDTTVPGSGVAVDGLRGWLSFQVGAPYSSRGRGELWDFTDEEVEALLDVVRAEGFTVGNWWRSGGNGSGLSVDGIREVES